MCTVGRVNVTFDTPQFGELELLHGELSRGGSWTPRSCTPRQRVAIIIPFRDRQLHLRTLLATLHPMLQRQMLQYTVFVVEQVHVLAGLAVTRHGRNCGFETLTFLQDHCCLPMMILCTGS